MLDKLRKNPKLAAGVCGLFVIVVTLTTMALSQVKKASLARANEIAEQILELENITKDLMIDEISANASSIAVESVDDADNVNNSNNESYSKISEVSNLAEQLIQEKRACSGERLKICETIVSRSQQLKSAYDRYVILNEWRTSSELSADNLAKLKSSSEKAATIYDQLEEYREKAVEFSGKYSEDSEIDENEMIELYSNLTQDLDDLEERARKMTFAEIYGASREELISLFDSVRELQEML